MSTSGSKALAAIRVSRVINAPRATVYQAWCDPSSFSKWWLNERNEPPMAIALDVRPGGKYCIVQTSDCGDEYGAPRDYRWVMDGEFLEVIPNTRIAFTWRVNDPGIPYEGQKVVVEFEDVPDAPGQTRVTITHTGITSEIVHRGTSEGWTGLLELQAKALEVK